MRIRLCLSVMAALCAVSCMAAEPLSPRFNPDTMMQSSEVERGMKAVGRSVFAGVEITEFNLEVLTVLEQANSGMDLVIARVLDGPVVERESGVMGGMSGSPVYINGKLVGAMAYTWQWEREPVAGITTINSMLAALDGPGKQASAPTGALLEPSDGSFEIAGRDISRVKIVPRNQAKGPFADDHTMVLYPVSAPVYCAGLPKGAMEYLKGALDQYGITPIAGPGGKRYAVDVKLEPGAAFGSSLVSGDIDISTGGTLTYLDGDLVLGFGHPFMELGKVSFPLTTSWVHDFIPRYSRTDKMMSIMKDVGVISQDRNWAVGGKLGAVAPRVPATIRVIDTTRDISKTYHVETIRHRDMTPSMVATSVLSAIYETYNSPGEGMVKVKVRVKGEKGDEISREDIYYHESDPGRPAITDLMTAASLLTGNRFRPQDVVEADCEVELSDVDDTVAVEGVTVDEPVARAGEDLTLHVFLRPDDGEVFEKTVRLKMPLSLEEGKMKIGVGGGSSAMALRTRAGVLTPTFYSLDSVADFFKNLERSDQLIITGAAPTKDASIKGNRLFFLPDMMKMILGWRPRTDMTLGGAEISQTIDLPWVVYGAAEVEVATENRLGGVGTVTPDSDDDDEEDISLPPGPALDGVPASLWWASSAFTKPALREAVSLPAWARASSGSGTPEPPPPPPPGADADEELLEKDAEKKQEEGKVEEGEEAPDEQPDDKEKGNVARKSLTWEQSTPSDFAQGDLKGVALRTDSVVQVAPPWADYPTFSETYILCLASSKDAVFAGTADPGRVYRREGEAWKLLHDTGKFGVGALLACDDGSVIAATFPQGELLRISPDGKAETLAKPECAYIWALTSDGSGGCYAGGGPQAQVYHVSAQGESRRLVTLDQQHVGALLAAGDDLYVGTLGKGVVYRLDADRKPSAVYDAGDSDVTALCSGPDDTVLVGVGPSGKVISLDARGTVKVLFDRDSVGVLDVTCVQDRIFAAMTDHGIVVEVIDEDTFAVVHEEEGNSTAIKLAHCGSELFLAADCPSRVRVADLAEAAQGTLESGILDAQRRSRWGRVDWRAEVPEGAGLELRLRSGNSADPRDGAWSGWASTLTGPGKDLAGPPPARFLQYLLTLTKPAGVDSPLLHWLRVRYMPDNDRPAVEISSPEVGEAISDDYTIEWDMEDPDNDQLRAKVLARLHGSAEWKPLAEDLDEGEYEWDTKKWDDGVYDLRIVVDDSPANATGSYEVHAEVLSVTVDNTAPELETISGPAEQKGGEFALTGFALDATCAITNIAWKPVLPDEGEKEAKSDADAKSDDEAANGEEEDEDEEADDEDEEEEKNEWRGAWLDDGVYDWRYEKFLIATGKLDASIKQIVVRVRDAAGNVTDKTVDLPERKQPEGEEQAKPAEAAPE